MSSQFTFRNDSGDYPFCPYAGEPIVRDTSAMDPTVSIHGFQQCVGFELGDPGDFPCSEKLCVIPLETFCRGSAGVYR